MRSHFADWAAHNSAKMDYLSAEQYERGLLEISLAGSWDYFRPSVWTATDQGTQGNWVRPSQELTTRGWAYNVWNITNTGDATYRSVQWLNITQSSVSQSIFLVSSWRETLRAARERPLTLRVELL